MPSDASMKERGASSNVTALRGRERARAPRGSRPARPSGGRARTSPSGSTRDGSERGGGWGGRGRGRRPLPPTPRPAPQPALRRTSRYTAGRGVVPAASDCPRGSGPACHTLRRPTEPSGSHPFGASRFPLAPDGRRWV